jgi:arylsulfatase A-like enzyme
MKLIFRNKKTIISVVLLLVLVIAGQRLFSALNASESLPNFVFIEVNELESDMLSCYESSQFQTPNIDLLAYQGLKFTKCFWGDNNYSSTLYQNNLNETVSMLQQSGYQTAQFTNKRIKATSQSNSAYSTDKCTNNVINYIKKSKPEKPFAVFISYGSLKTEKEVAPRHAALPNVGLYPTLYAIDENVGRLFKFLEDTNLVGNTVFVFTSARLNNSKSPMPLIFRYPEIIKPNSVSSDYCTSADLLPTILDITGTKIPDNIKGRSLKPFFELSRKGVKDEYTTYLISKKSNL